MSFHNPSLPFKFQYDNTLSNELQIQISKYIKFKFQYDNTLRYRCSITPEYSSII